MKKKNIIVLIIITLMITFVIIIVNIRRKELVKHEFKNSIRVESNLNIDYVDTMSLIILDKIYEIDTINLYLVEANKSLFYKLSNDEYEIYAFIVDYSHVKNNTYFIFFSDMVNSNNIKDVLCHEFVHLKQMYDKRLIVDEYGYYWNGEYSLFVEVEYSKRPHEIEAFENQLFIKKQLIYLMYN